MIEPRASRDPAADRDGADPRVPLPAARRSSRSTRSTPSRLQVWPPTGLHAPLVRRGGVATRRCSRPSSTRSIVAHRRDGDRPRPRHARGAGRRSATRSSDARPSRSSSSCRSPCRASSPASRCARTFVTVRDRLRPVHDRRRPRHLLRRHRLQQRDRPPAPACRARPRRPPRTSGADAFSRSGGSRSRGMRTALLSGGLLAFALSFDEIIVTNFTAGAGTQTLPMWILHGDPARRPSSRSSTWSALVLIRRQRDPGLASRPACRRRAAAWVER